MANKKETWNNLVRKYFHNVNNFFCHHVLWSATCFPAGSAEQVENNLKELSKRFNQKKFKNNKVLLSSIMQYSDKVTEDAMRSINAEI